MILFERGRAALEDYNISINEDISSTHRGDYNELVVGTDEQKMALSLVRDALATGTVAADVNQVVFDDQIQILADWVDILEGILAGWRLNPDVPQSDKVQIPAVEAKINYLKDVKDQAAGMVIEPPPVEEFEEASV